MEYIELELLPVSLASKEGIHAQCMFKYSLPPAGFIPAEGAISVVVFALFASERLFLFAETFQRLHRPIFPLSSGLPV